MSKKAVRVHAPEKFWQLREGDAARFANRDGRAFVVVNRWHDGDGISMSIVFDGGARAYVFAPEDDNWREPVVFLGEGRLRVEILLAQVAESGRR